MIVVYSPKNVLVGFNVLQPFVGSLYPDTVNRLKTPTLPLEYDFYHLHSSVESLGMAYGIGSTGK